MNEIYRAGAAITRGLGRAAGYLGRRSEEVSERLRRAAQESEEKRLREAVSQDAAPRSGVEEFRERADAWADDLGEKLRTVIARAKEEGGEVADTVKREAAEAIARLNAAVNESAEKKSPQAGKTSPSEDGQEHF